MKLHDLPDEVLAHIPQYLKDQLRDLSLPEPKNWNLLVLQYVRPAKLDNGLYLPEAAMAEDRYQGRLGFVLAMGETAFADKKRFPTGALAKVGDVVMWPASMSAVSRFAYGDATLSLLPDTSVVAVVPHDVPLQRIVGA